MPRPKVDRRARSVRLPAEVDELLVAEAKARSVSVNGAIAAAVLEWAGGPREVSATARHAPASPSGPCPHDEMVHRGYGTFCKACGKKVR